MTMTLKAARVNKGLSQRRAASLLGIAVDTISKYERGETSPNVQIIKKIEILYGINFNDIIFSPTNA